MKYLVVVLSLFSVVLFTSCGKTTGEPGMAEPNFKVIGATESFIGAPVLARAATATTTSPTKVEIYMEKVTLFENEDCTGNSVDVTPKEGAKFYDMTSNPEIFWTHLPPSTTYNCMMIKMKDVIRFIPAATVGAQCVAGTTYNMDIHQSDHENAVFNPETGQYVWGTDYTGPKTGDMDITSTNQFIQDYHTIVSTAVTQTTTTTPEGQVYYVSVFKAGHTPASTTLLYKGRNQMLPLTQAISIPADGIYKAVFNFNAANKVSEQTMNYQAGADEDGDGYPDSFTYETRCGMDQPSMAFEETNI